MHGCLLGFTITLGAVASRVSSELSSATTAAVEAHGDRCIRTCKQERDSATQRHTGRLPAAEPGEAAAGAGKHDDSAVGARHEADAVGAPWAAAGFCAGHL